MTTIVTRAGKGSPLTWDEGDANFNNLNAAVIAAQATADTALAAATTTFTSIAVGVVPASGGGTTNFLRADGSWAAAGGSATPAGADTEIQYNNVGAFGAISSFTWNETTKRFRINGTNANCTTPGTHNFYGARPSGTGTGGGIQIFGGRGGVTSGDGGVVEIQGGQGSNTGNGGGVNITGGLTGTTATDVPGDVTVTGGSGNDNAGNVLLVGGSASTALAAGGNIKLRGGQPGAGGNQGQISFESYDGAIRYGTIFTQTGNFRWGSTTTDPTYFFQIDGPASNVAVRIVQGATGGTALSLTDSTAASTLNFQPGTTTSYITYSHPLSFYSGGADQVTISTAGVLNATGDVQIGGVSVRTIPQNSQSAAYTLVAGDAGKHILHPSADTTARVFTIPANSSVAFPIGTAVTFVNQNAAGTITISITTDTMRLAGAGTTGSRTLAANGIATALKITSTEWIISGTGLT